MEGNEMVVAGKGFLTQYGVTNVEQAFAALRANLGGDGGSGAISLWDLDRVKVPAGGGISWEIPQADGETQVSKTFKGIIVGWTEGRSFFAGKYTPGEASPPDCTSIDGIEGDGEPGGLCAQCPNAKWGSATGADGKPSRGQSCRTQRSLFVLIPGSILPIVLTVPPTSLKDCRKYFLRLTQISKPFWAVETVFGLTRGAMASTITFQKGADIPADQLADIQAYTASIEPLMRAKRDDEEGDNSY